MYTSSMKRLAVLLPLFVLALAPAANAAPKPQLYVSLGDSYASGYQPDVGNTKAGFVYQVPGLAKQRGYNLKVVNFGCGGATTKSLIYTKGCPKAALGPGAKSYKTTQLKAATKFIKANRKRIALITVSIGGNDVTSCVKSADPITCVGEATNTIKANVSLTAEQLRLAAGPKPLMVGITYPDVVLGAWVNPGTDSSKSLANLSVLAFQSLINPALKESYAKGDGRFVDVTAATGAYGDMSVFESLDPYGSIPKPVADVCKITWYCSKGDIHANRDGYAVIARMVSEQLPQR